MMLRARLVVVGVALLLAGCGEQPDPEAAADPDPVNDEVDDSDGPVANACPPEGCEIEIVDVVGEGDELRITWEANFLPDVSRNHIHVYWDHFTADQASIDASARGVEQGTWSVTDDYPAYVTEGDASTAERGDSTSICVTAADRDHAVLDSSLFDCFDVADHLED